MSKINYYDKAGGHEGILKLVKQFYNVIFRHPELSGFFAEVSQEFQETQFTDFMAQLLGGPKRYGGRPPNGAHVHLYIAEHHFEERHEILKNILQRSQLAEEVVQEWLRLDYSFKQMIVKSHISDCKPKYKMGKILTANPIKKAS